MTSIARFTRLLHPAFAAKSLKCGGVVPNLCETLILHVLELHSRNYRRGVAGKRCAIRRNQHQLPSPAAYARLWETRIVVWDNEHDASRPFQPLFGFFYHVHAIIELLAGR